jgi:hypothetical protein
MKRCGTLLVFVTATVAAGCGAHEPARTFADDLAFLRKHGPVEVLGLPDGPQVACSAKYQARVMTSTVEPGGRSFGWINRGFVGANARGHAFDNFGGEDRFWLGPEGGPNSIFFDDRDPFYDWSVPEALNQGKWRVRSRDQTSVTYEADLEVRNDNAYRFKLKVVRTIRMLNADDLARHLSITGPSQMKWVGFESVNRVINMNDEPWDNRKRGLLSVWILGQFPTSRDAYVIVPFRPWEEGAVVNDEYFGKVPADRLNVDRLNGFILLRGDGRYRSKIGLQPDRAKNVLGSYNHDNRCLTIVHYDKPEGVWDYVNNEWGKRQRRPYRGDVINSYNDGPGGFFGGRPGGFYELETSSPAIMVEPRGWIEHTHRTFHFVPFPSTDQTDDSREIVETLDPIALRVLGVSVSKVLRDTEKQRRE